MNGNGFHREQYQSRDLWMFLERNWADHKYWISVIKSVNVKSWHCSQYCRLLHMTEDSIYFTDTFNYDLVVQVPYFIPFVNPFWNTC